MNENSDRCMNHAMFVFNGEGELLDSSPVKLIHSGVIAVLALEDMVETHENSWGRLKDNLISALQCLKQNAIETEIRSLVAQCFRSSHGFSVVSLGAGSHDDNRKFTSILNPQLSDGWSSQKCYSEYITRILGVLKSGMSAIAPEIMMSLPGYCLGIFLIPLENDTNIRTSIEFLGKHKCTVENGAIAIPKEWGNVKSSKNIVKQSLVGNYWEVYPEVIDFANTNLSQKKRCCIDDDGRLVLPSNIRPIMKSNIETQVITLLGCGYGFLIPIAGNS